MFLHPTPIATLILNTGLPEVTAAERMYLTGQVGVEHFALDDEPELLPASLATLTAAQVATDGRALSGCGHLVGRKNR